MATIFSQIPALSGQIITIPGLIKPSTVAWRSCRLAAELYYRHCKLIVEVGSDNNAEVPAVVCVAGHMISFNQFIFHPFLPSFLHFL